MSKYQLSSLYLTQLENLNKQIGLLYDAWYEFGYNSEITQRLFFGLLEIYKEQKEKRNDGFSSL